MNSELDINMPKNYLLVILRIATFTCAIFPVSQLAIIALVLIIYAMISGEFLINPVAVILGFVILMGGVSGFVGLILCVRKKYNYFTLVLLLHGATSLIYFFKKDLLEFNFFTAPLYITLALCIPNGILCITNQRNFNMNIRKIFGSLFTKRNGTDATHPGAVAHNSDLQNLKF